MQKVNEFLQSKKVEFGSSLEQRWAIIEELYNKRLYHQLTVQLLELLQLPELQNGTQSIDLYNNFIAHLETKLNALSLVEMAVYAVRQIEDANQAITFLSTLEKKVQSNTDAVNLCKVLAAQIYIDKFKDFKQTKKIIEEIEETLDEANDISLVHGRFYALASNYHRLMNNHADYYRTSLRYLGCIDLNTLPKDLQHQQAFFLCLAALLGEKVYNLGELLAHSIIESLRNTEHEWLVELVGAFNKGSISVFEEMKPKWSSIGDLKVQEAKLREKISLLCLIEMAFNRPAHNKQLTFSDIAQETKLPLNQIELLVMKALSQGLVRGAIDQVAETVNLTWVQPRVLNQNQIRSMAERLNKWSIYVGIIEEILEKQTTEIISSDLISAKQ